MDGVGADDRLEILEVRLDRPTLHNLGVQVLIDGDDDRDAHVSLRYRQQEEVDWQPGPPLLRVWPETVWIDVLQQFSGSVFDLEPGTAYEIELEAHDPDGGGERRVVAATTRPIPRSEPKIPQLVEVNTSSQLHLALGAAVLGHVIHIRSGIYDGPFAMNAHGTADNPIVIRGHGAETILDGGDCSFCDVLDLQGSWIHVEDLTVRSAMRGLRFATVGAEGNVARRLHVFDIVHASARTWNSATSICVTM